MKAILIATNNRKKAAEIQAILQADEPNAPLPIRWRTLAEFPNAWPEPIEDGETFEANAIIKAQHYAKLSGLWTLADDSGLEVDALNGEPGVYSARFAGEPSDDHANNAMLIERLAHIHPNERSARFRCVLAVCEGDTVLARSFGSVEGRIIDEPRGQNGFGYDPHFYVERFNMTAAEMTSDQKNSISHRSQALRALRPQLVTLLAP